MYYQHNKTCATTGVGVASDMPIKKEYLFWRHFSCPKQTVQS